MDDAEAAKFYENPANRVPVGPMIQRRRRPRKLTAHVPIRFDAATVEAVKRFAEDDGVTVSTWIRQVVRQRIESRSASVPQTWTAHCSPATLTIEWDAPDPRESAG